MQTNWGFSFSPVLVGKSAKSLWHLPNMQTQRQQINTEVNDSGVLGTHLRSCRLMALYEGRGIINISLKKCCFVLIKKSEINSWYVIIVLWEILMSPYISLLSWLILLPLEKFFIYLFFPSSLLHHIYLSLCKQSWRHFLSQEHF